MSVAAAADAGAAVAGAAVVTLVVVVVGAAVAVPGAEVGDSSLSGKTLQSLGGVPSLHHWGPIQ